MKTLKKEHGEEFIFIQILNYCKEHGIKRQLTMYYKLQQNDMAKGKNRTIVEMARSILKEKGLPNKLWAEVISITICILNCFPINAV